MNYQDIFDNLWTGYTNQNPSTKMIYDLFLAEGEKVINDHIAFRTFRHPEIGVDKLSQVFLQNGYEYKGDYHFEVKKLYAKHFEHRSDPGAPRVFISELLTGEFSPFLQQTVNDWISRIPLSRIHSDDLIYAGNISGIPSFEVYEKLRTESEYAAWLYVNGFCANHFTVSVNRLKKLDTIRKVNTFLKSHGFLAERRRGRDPGNTGRVA